MFASLMHYGKIRKLPAATERKKKQTQVRGWIIFRAQNWFAALINPRMHHGPDDDALNQRSWEFINCCAAAGLFILRRARTNK